ncbi:antibiotic biosynthesis monooxygenase [Noviherbaspirillum denitrificans]|uniref:ABM domain-containing protein n=1 Tax=Noviherbaspirillum denitrificans TaxID=1968433 RepID=A0A254TIN2_9BURK|nr:antibiotic biosynthesis monooxygenase [Noviherbaspirillum denitrificans]OWW21202.1 hypothetical protein AYR66_18700 [Noviherbaspirillum denitrificans]
MTDLASAGTAATSPENDSVTFVVYHHVAADRSNDYEQWLSRIIPVAQGFPGYLGVGVLRPATGSDLYTLVLRFASADHLRGWVESRERTELLADVESMLSNTRTEIQPGTDFWYTPPEPGAKHPIRWKQYVMVLLIIFPLTLVVPEAWELLFDRVPWMNSRFVRHFGAVAISVFLMVYVILPRAMKRLGRWLVT